MSFLRIGTPHRKVRPPRGGPPCIEPYVRGTNILRDPGFETLGTELTAGGHTKVPTWLNQSGCRGSIFHDVVLDASDNVTSYGACAYGTNLGWYQDDSSGSPASPNNFWIVSTANPRTGTYHIRCPINATEVFNLFAVGVLRCADTSVAYSARVEAGDYVKYSYWATRALTTPDIAMVANLDFYDSSGNALSSVTTTSAYLTTSYQQISVDTFAPASSYYVDATLISSTASGTPNDNIDIDDAVLEVST